MSDTKYNRRVRAELQSKVHSLWLWGMMTEEEHDAILERIRTRKLEEQEGDDD